MDLPDNGQGLDAFMASTGVQKRTGEDGAEFWHLRAFTSGPMGQPPIQSASIPVGVDDPEDLCRRTILPMMTMWLDGRSRFQLAGSYPQTSLREPPTNHLMAIWRDPGLFREIDGLIRAAFEKHLVIDFTEGDLKMGLTDEDAPPGDWLLSSIPEVVGYVSRAQPITAFSDGVNVYAGVVAAVSAIQHVLLLVDEPEAFLHPTLARRLGSHLAKSARTHQSNVIAATHSADFLYGCVAEDPETTIIRLGYERGIGSARALEGAMVRKLFGDPLLRSARALDALFAKAAVVCEGDADRAFYDEINRRLIESSRGSIDTVFLNAQNWQTIGRIAGPLRQLGIPAAIVVDLDALLENNHWAEFAAIVSVNTTDRDAFLQARQTAADPLMAAGRVSDAPGAKYRCKYDGLAAVTDEAARSKVQASLDSLALYGVFAVPVGELENWLAQFGVTNKQTWVTEMLVRLGAVDDAHYAVAGDGDVWSFVDKIAAWISDPNRLGVP